MGIFQILFIAINVAFPVYLWTRTSTEKSKTDWVAFERNLSRVVESDEGFPGCSTFDVVDIFHQLCESSFQKSKKGPSLIMEKTSSQLVFSCRYNKDTITVAWRLEDGRPVEMGCNDPGGVVVGHGPGFNFTPQGRIKSIEFFNEDNEREQVPYRNCRVKAERIKSITKPPERLVEFLQLLGKAPGDPPDFYHANMMCFTFDSSPLWKPWREKYFQ
ncbi:MAG: hypothetical protein ACXVA9_13405 [Bdellovibrionales bacterium]